MKIRRLLAHAVLRITGNINKLLILLTLKLTFGTESDYSHDQLLFINTMHMEFKF